MGNCFGSESAAKPPPAAQKTANGHHVTSKSAMKPFVGCNCYYLLTRSSDAGCRPMVLQTLDSMQQMGFTVVRTWAFNDGPGWMSLQPQAGVYSQQVLEGLDWLLVEAGKRGLQVMLTLTNYWSEFGGMAQYVRWSRGLPDGTQVDSSAFFTDERAQQLYIDFITTVTTRVNTLTGVPYCNDPTIHSWDLANEPRCDSDSSASAIAAWIDKTAAHVKGLDSNHMVTVGMEGFFGNSTPDLQSANPYPAQHGVDFVRDFRSPHIDFACIHMYADQWCPCKDDDSACVSWSVKWVQSHIQVCERYLGGKPLVLQEFGKRPAGRGRTALFTEVRE
eukprot:GHUV01010894.1.p1 GENE.GHUV01010894.1~~GHUV01010894.1.p1  ORF type:complete len:332 (+),score=66.25 GHUV01010894.1:778-1773(+)